MSLRSRPSLFKLVRLGALTGGLAVTSAAAKSDDPPAKSDSPAARSEPSQLRRTKSVGGIKPTPTAEAVWPVPGFNRKVSFHQADTTDSTAKKIYWAKQLKFGGADADTLNYDIRVLGREGYLSLNAVANMSELSVVEKDMQDVLAMTEFDTGRRHCWAEDRVM